MAYVFDKPIAIFTLIVLLVFVGLCLAPLHCFYMRARKEVLVVLYNIVISPFGLVRFKHFFLADVLTSFVNPLKDIALLLYFFINGNWLTSKRFEAKDNFGLLMTTLIIALLPFWFRFAQCLVRYKETKLNAHLWNAGKYMSSLFLQLANMFRTLCPLSPVVVPLYICVALASTIYCLIWDYYMDWGLIRSNEAGKRYLRPKLLFPRWFYYYAMASNCVMRFFWATNLIHTDANHWVA